MNTTIAHPGRSTMRGFSLIEVLLATVLLAAGLALGFATLRAAGATTQRGEQLAQRSERMRAVEGFLRRRLSSALPIGFAMDDQTGVPIRFIGDLNRMRFVADLPDYLGRGGPYLHDVAVLDTDGGGERLAASFEMVVAGETIAEREPRPPESLVPNLVSARFRYRGLDNENRLGAWQEAWERSDQLPLMVSIELVSREGGAEVRWPPLVVALPQAAANFGEGMRTVE